MIFILYSTRTLKKMSEKVVLERTNVGESGENKTLQAREKNVKAFTRMCKSEPPEKHFLNKLRSIRRTYGYLTHRFSPLSTYIVGFDFIAPKNEAGKDVRT